MRDIEQVSQSMFTSVLQLMHILLLQQQQNCKVLAETYAEDHSYILRSRAV